MNRPLRVVAAVELATLVVLVANLMTVHHPAVSGIAGPLHGLAYTATVIAALLVMDGRHRVWLLALVPGVGGLLAVKALEQQGKEAGLG
ncbi:hypothetical protein BJF85_21255 [Saccharomonospora sp. CUA-673]|uniref:hypothetical protein n=1 Tax=Saccharomonospora sp. CUA-673 TaxID=1904969 RepID=UPI000960C782|nr:hypothetical protein [Saccharomonospora sp. CUA-673]OLT43756.1 hypothetical protein BJF85_21255 [Saccharomonospora sp. CUA-673]